MPFTKSLRAKVLLAALVPTVLALVVAIITLIAYEREAGLVVRERDAELAQVSAARLFDGLSLHRLILQSTADDNDTQSLEPDRMRLALARAQDRLFIFDAGVVIYGDEGIAIWSDPFAFRRRGQQFPIRLEFAKVRSSGLPSFSNVFRDAASEKDVILLTVPIARGPEFRGVLAGMYTLDSLRLDPTFSEILEITPGSERFAYLVDGTGRAIFHPDRAKLGADLSASGAVDLSSSMETGAIITDDPDGITVISGFAPIADTNWTIITQERWENVVGSIRGFSKLLVGLLLVGGALAGGLILITVGRILKPVKELTEGARRVAGGDFDRPIETKTGDEVRALAEQFNVMAGALKESYAGLEQKVAERTVELERRAAQMAAINDIAIKVSSILSLDELLPYVTDLLRDAFQYYVVSISLIEEGSDYIVLRAGAGAAGGAIHPIGHRLKLGQGINGWVAERGETVLANDVTMDPRFLFIEEFRDVKAELTVPITLGDEVVGVLDIESTRLNAFDETDQFTVETLAHCLAVAIEKARLFEQTRELAVLEERNRMAREIHDTLAQGFTGIVIQLEAAEQAAEQDRHTEVPAHLFRARSLARESLQEARRSVWNLLPHALEEQSLDAALEEKVRRFAAEGHELASFSLSGVKRVLVSDIETAVYRICQESLVNIRRHANATEVGVELAFQPDAICLSVQDNGSGFDVQSVKSSDRQSGFGLMGMRQRATLLGGAVTLESQRGSGTLVKVRIPTPAG